MRQILLFILSVTLLFQAKAQVKEAVWTRADRNFLAQGLRSTKADLLHEVEALSNKQLHFKIDPQQWSVAEVLEHLGVYEELLLWDLTNNQYTEERPDLEAKVKGIDSLMLAYTTDPAKGTAPAIAQPLGRFKNKASLIHFFLKNRDEVLKLVTETQTDFRLHFIFRPPDWGAWHLRDLHQYTLLWIAHTTRHTNQIRRIKADRHFPKIK